MHRKFPDLGRRALLAALLAFPPALPHAAMAADTGPGDRRLRVIGGVVSAEGMWPSMVSLQIIPRTPGLPPEARLQSVGRKDLHLCGGSVIGEKWVLTAAHCVVFKEGILRPSAVVAYEGSRLLDARSGHPVEVAEVIPHPGYTMEPITNDIALLRLAAPSQQVRQKLLSDSDRPDTLRPGVRATVAGFGLTRDGDDKSGSDVLRHVDLPLVSRSECMRGYQDLEPAYFGDFAICAGNAKGGVDSCQGDSGGPLYSNRNGETVQVGVVSWGDHCARPGRFGVYTSVGHFEQWIKAHVPDADFTTRLAPAPAPPAPPPGPMPAPLPAPAPIPPNAGANCLTAGVVPGTLSPSQVVQVSIDIVQGNRLPLGSVVNFRVRSSMAGELYVYAIDPANQVTTLFPNRRTTGYMPGQATPTIRPGQTMRIPGYADGFEARVKPPTGAGIVCAVVTPATYASRAAVERLLALPSNVDLATFRNGLQRLIETNEDYAPADRPLLVDPAATATAAPPPNAGPGGFTPVASNADRPGRQVGVASRAYEVTRQ